MFRRKQKSYIAKAAALTLAFAAAGSTAAYAGTWNSDTFGDGTWSYADTNEVQQTGWKWLDGNKDGIYECYYFDSDGKMLAGTKIGQDAVSADGAWILNGSIQHRSLPSWLQYKKQYGETSTQALNEKIAYPQISLSGSDLGEKVNEHILGYIKTVRENARPEGDILGNAAENDLDYDFLLSKSGKYAGLSFQNYLYTGGAHGMTDERYYTLTPEKGILKMSDIGGKALENAITSYVRNELKKRSDDGSLVLFTNPDSLNIDYERQNWMLADDGIHVLFQQYEIAPYAAGLIDVTVPYSAVKGQMNAYGQGLI